MALLLNRSVLPSGAARATTSVPISVPAPGRFSITIDCPRVRPISSARMRASTSMPPPGGYGTISLIACEPCDHAGAATSASSAPTIAAMTAAPSAKRINP